MNHRPVHLLLVLPFAVTCLIAWQSNTHSKELKPSASLVFSTPPSKGVRRQYGGQPNFPISLSFSPDSKLLAPCSSLVRPGHFDRCAWCAPLSGPSSFGRGLAGAEGRPLTSGSALSRRNREFRQGGATQGPSKMPPRNSTALSRNASSSRKRGKNAK